jgi:hypothetical protein
LPLGLAIGQPKADVVARLGAPTSEALLGPFRWERDDLTLVITWNRSDTVGSVHCAMTGAALRARTDP